VIFRPATLDNRLWLCHAEIRGETGYARCRVVALPVEVSSLMSNGNSLRFVTFCEPKRGHGPQEYEDAFAGNLALGRFAVADGATESAYAGLWARMLVNEFVSTASAEPSCWANWLPALQTQWESAVGQAPMPWYAEMKWQQGAFATFLGLVLEPPRWQ